MLNISIRIMKRIQYAFFMLVYLFLVACGDDKESHPEVNASIELSNDITRYAGQKIKSGANTINAEHIKWDLGDGTQTNDSTFTPERHGSQPRI